MNSNVSFRFRFIGFKHVFFHSRFAGSADSRLYNAVHVLTGCDYTSKIGTKHAALEDFGTKIDESALLTRLKNTSPRY